MTMDRKTEFVSIGSLSHPGIVRSDNQDCCAYYVPGDDLSSRGILLIVADGMGGHSGGAVASKLAVDILMMQYYKCETQDVSEALELSFRRANEEIAERARHEAELKGMATTLTAVVLKEDKLYYAHVGDSRGYLISDHKITQFTNDHSYVADLIRAGVIKEEEAETHPKRNVITRAVGAEVELKVDLPHKNFRLKPDEYILLCSDGLYKVMKDEEIRLIFERLRGPDQLCDELVKLAIERGGPDNITVMVARINKVPGRYGFVKKLMSKIL
ncbi:MAG: Stp1/IreP family PP2C-type Ser/Thr phosphatase [Desulfobacteraceae bacterium]|nr:MAG: Stp1/IreP family PP2C-type Ser/Thr phosphatase [Desulfobacteraceae bacterium]